MHVFVVAIFNGYESAYMDSVKAFASLEAAEAFARDAGRWGEIQEGLAPDPLRTYCDASSGEPALGIWRFPVASEWTGPSETWGRDERGVWRHGYGPFFVVDAYPRPLLRVGFDPPLASVGLALVVAEVDRYLRELGGRFCLDLSVTGSERYYDFAPAEPPEVDLQALPELALPQDGWEQLFEGLWVHGPGKAVAWVWDSVDHGGNAGRTFTLTWKPGGEDAIAPLRAHLEAAGLSGFDSTPLPDGSQALQFNWYERVSGPPVDLPL